jgi:hypothetical protein
MLFGQDRHELRSMYSDAWEKQQAGAVLTPLEAQIAQVISEHPEYHSLISAARLEDFSPEGGQTNPYLHMGLHLSVREQVATDRPPGIRAIFDKLRSRTGDPLEAEHWMIECLAESLWEAQRSNSAPDEQRYIERLRQLG